MKPLEEAILRTILYADVFNFPMTFEEIHHFLMYHQPVSAPQVEHTLATSAALQHVLCFDRGYVALMERPHLVAQRLERDQASATLWPLARHYGLWMARLPYVRMVAVTGALAVGNAAHTDDDLDYLIVTSANRVWLARALAVVLVRLAKRRGVTVCPNYVLSENAFEQKKKDLFIAHEIAQMIPVYGYELYTQFRTANAWVFAHLPNAQRAFFDEDRGGRGWFLLKQVLEGVLRGTVGDALERWEYRRKLRRFEGDLHTPHSAAQLDEQHVKGHFNDYGYFVLRQYHERLQTYGLDTVTLSATGD
jgi:hypothetical protein